MPRFTPPDALPPARRQRCAASLPRLDSNVNGERPTRTYHAPSDTAAASDSAGRARTPTTLCVSGRRIRASCGRRARAGADCGKLLDRVHTAAGAAAAR